MIDLNTLNQQLTAAGCIAAGKLEWFDEIGSTNDYIMAKPKVHGHVCLAGLQTAGRGRRGKQWQAPAGSSILMSLGMNIELQKAQGLSLVCGLSVRQTLADMGIQGVTLKWPNDVLLNATKLAGILIDISNHHCVIGLGLNVNIPKQAMQSDTQINQPWTALSQHGYQPDMTELAMQLIDNMYKNLENFVNTGFNPFISEWNQYHHYHGKKVAMSGPEITQGTVSGVDQSGGLMLQTANGLQVFYAGEYSLLPQQNAQ